MGCNGDTQSMSSALLKHIIQPKHILQVIDECPNASTTTLLRQKFFSELKDIVTPMQMVEVCDSAGISTKGYSSLYKVITIGRTHEIASYTI